MHSPRPYGLHAVGGELTPDDSISVEALARRLTNLKELSGVDSLRMVRTLPDGGYAIAQDMGGTFRVITHKQKPNQKTLPFDGFAKDYVPMLYSGVITKAKLREGEGLGMKLSEQTRRRINNYKNLDRLPSKTLSLLRFRIDYNDIVQEFKPKEDAFSEKLETQYLQQRPTWYSGAMAEVMQIVGGYGIQDVTSLPNNPIERAQFAVPSDVLKNIRVELSNKRLPGYKGLPDADGQFQYDYKFSSTHGVGFDDKNKPWLIQINTRGVWVMPLPLIPATTTKAFRKYIVEVDDQEIIRILDRFGGMPSGESFPEGDVFQAWQRAGVVIKVCEAGDIYSHAAYASTCGWTFNLNGNEGFNTAYDYYDDTGLGYGLAYKLKLNLSHTVDGGWLGPISNENNPELGARINGYLNLLFKVLSDSNPKHVAIKYKIRRASEVSFRDRVTRINPNWNDEVNYWDNLEQEPIAKHTGNIVEVGRGYLFSYEQFKFQPQIKFPEPFEKGCISHDFLPQKVESQLNKPCDTIVYGYYIGDSLKVVKYFRDATGYTAGVINDYEGCMIVGSWTQTESDGFRTINGSFYTTDIDDRASFAPRTTTTTIVGKDRGYKPFFEFDAFGSRTGSLWRNRYFTHKTNTETTEGRTLKIGICIPYFCRNAMLYATSTSISASSRSENVSLYAVRDPTSYRYWTYDFVFAYFGSLPVERGMPKPTNGNPVWVEMEEYNPTTCGDFADQGSWVSVPADYGWLIHPKSNEWLHAGSSAPIVNTYNKSTTGGSSATGNAKVDITEKIQTISISVPDKDYFLGSPNEKSVVFYRDGCKVVFGESIYANVSEAGDGGRRKYFGYSNLIDHQSAYHFIGVINE